jgi:hypothetical protein
MPNSISEKIKHRSANELGDLDYNSIYALIEFLSAHRYHEYGPTFGPHLDFRERLTEWLANGVPEQDQKLLFQLVPYIFFVGRDEIAALQRATFRNSILRWVIEDAGIDFADPDLDNSILREIRRTWFCPITDSADIASFHHLNDLRGEYRPDWRSFAKMHNGDPSLLLQHMADEGYTRVVLTEDIVGSGSQMLDLWPLFENLPTTPPTMPVLIVPLIVCPRGVQAGQRLASRFPNIQFAPTLTLPKDSFVSPIAQSNEPSLFQAFRDLVQRSYPVVSNGQPVSATSVPYGPFGFAQTGGLIVLHTNTPDNSLPVIHHSSNSWSPLFPRRRRIP